MWDIHAPHHDEDAHDHDEAEHDHEHEGEAHDHPPGEAHDHEHESREGEAASPATQAPGPNKQVTAVLIKFRSPMGQLQLPRMINEYTNMQAAVPAIEINRLQTLLGTGAKVLRALGWLLAGLAACSIFVTLVQGTHERRYELALIRTMGGSGANCSPSFSPKHSCWECWAWQQGSRLAVWRCCSCNRSCLPATI